MFHKSTFQKMLVVLAVGFVLGYSDIASDAGKQIYKDNKAASEMIGYSDTYFLNASSADATPTISATYTNWGNCRGISADSTGLVKIDYKNAKGETVTEVTMLVQGVIRPVRNVIKLYRYYTGTTAGTAKSYTSAGVVTTNAIKLHR